MTYKEALKIKVGDRVKIRDYEVVRTVEEIETKDIKKLYFRLDNGQLIPHVHVESVVEHMVI